MSTPPAPRIPETIGATSAPFYLGITPSQIEFPVHAPAGPALLASGAAQRRMFLRIDNLTAEVDAPSYDVYVNLPPGADPKKRQEYFVGFTPTFGLIAASLPENGHPGNGLGTQLEVTAVLLRLAATKEWDGKTLRVTFVPEGWNDTPAKLRVGRVSLIIG